MLFHAFTAQRPENSKRVRSCRVYTIQNVELGCCVVKVACSCSKCNRRNGMGSIYTCESELFWSDVEPLYFYGMSDAVETCFDTGENLKRTIGHQWVG